ncbi:MAG: 6-carboxytetrahydropterin synthase QueD [Dehalococcoidia bacterium]|nr:MAG: 6-carboxytetrahydropterin synthase QueD [Dehalococcoidia bacterium]
MYKISVEQNFDAAHALRGYKGKCEALHGHRFRVVARVTTLQLNDIGLAYDFTQLKAELKILLEHFDHTTLNDIPPFDEINPSSENIASTLYDQLKTALKQKPVKLEAVEVWESPESGVEYSPE